LRLTLLVETLSGGAGVACAKTTPRTSACTYGS
jgi:hypothetical protein